MWAIYCQHPSRRSSPSRLTTDGGKAVSCWLSEVPQMRSRTQSISKDSRRELNRTQRHEDRRSRNANRGDRRAITFQKNANGHPRISSQVDRFWNALPRTGNEGHRNANMRHFGSRVPHFRLTAPQKPFCTPATYRSRLISASPVFHRPPLPTKPRDQKDDSPLPGAADSMLIYITNPSTTMPDAPTPRSNTL